MRRKLPLLPILVLVALVGSAAGQPVEGTLRAESFEATAEVAASAAGGAFALARSPAGAIELVIEGAVGTLERTSAPVASATVGTTTARHILDAQPEREVVELDDATITSILTRADAAVLLWPGSGASEVRLFPDGVLEAAAAGPTTLSSQPADASVESSKLLDRHAVEVDVPHVNLTAPAGELRAGGALGIYLYNFDFDVAQGGESARYSAGYSTQADGGAARQGRVEKDILILTAGVLHLRTLDAVSVHSATSEVAVDGQVTLGGASGTLRGADAVWTAVGEARLDGVATYLLTPAAPAGGSVLGNAAPALAIAIDGDATPIGFRLLEDGTELFGVTSTTAAAAAGGGVLLLAIVGAVAWRKRHPPARPEGLVEEAVLRLEAGDVQGALALFNAAAAKDPRNALLHLDRAHCLDRLGRIAEARRSYELAVRFAPENGEAHYHLARSLATTGLAPSAIAHLTRAFNLDPAFAQAAREDPAFDPLRDHPSYTRLDQYYARPA